MRDINRIDVFTEEFNQIWNSKFPDWRFGQIISNFTAWYSHDIFYLEEDKFMEKFREFSDSC